MMSLTLLVPAATRLLRVDREKRSSLEQQKVPEEAAWQSKISVSVPGR